MYICEGTKLRTDNRNRKVHSVEFTNTDPRVIKLFLEFLRKIINAEEQRIKAELFIYPDHDEEGLIEFWSKSTKIPKERFNKTIRLKQKNYKFKPNPLGTFKIRYHHKKHFLRIQDMINESFGEE
ncbi:MAG: hypothetical protein AAB531_05765 [Patescibacteria group bacterium]